jgi:hypothetical protein
MEVMVATRSQVITEMTTAQIDLSIEISSRDSTSAFP